MIERGYESLVKVVCGPTKTALGLHCALELAPGADLPKLPKSVKVAAQRKHRGNASKRSEISRH